jgi:hypothetical protein
MITTRTITIYENKFVARTLPRSGTTGSGAGPRVLAIKCVDEPWKARARDARAHGQRIYICYAVCHCQGTDSERTVLNVSRGYERRFFVYHV